MSIKDIKQENRELRKKLEIAQNWMKREIQNQIVSLSKTHIWLSPQTEEEITENIFHFFWSISLMSIPENTIEYLVQSEVQYALLKQGTNIDGLSVTLGYQKILELLIQEFVISKFKRFIDGTNTPNMKISTDWLENALHMVIEKNYSLWIGRFYHLLQDISAGKDLTPIKALFHDFLEKDSTLKNILLENDFLLQLEIVVESEVFSTKRHSGSISLSDVEIIRNTCIWDLDDPNCLMYSLLKTQQTL